MPDPTNSFAPPVERPARRGRPFERGAVARVEGWRRLGFWPVAVLLRLYLATLRVRIEASDAARFRETAGSRTIVKWHSFSLIVPRVLQELGCIEKTATLVSASRQGALQSRFYEWYGMRVERGSVSRRGLHALRALLRWQSQGFDVVLSPDGPSGPRHSFRPGAAFLARLGGGPIVCLGIECRWALRARTWDRHLIPLPFAAVRARIEKVDSYAAEGWKSDEQAAEALRARLLALTPREPVDADRSPQ